MELHAGNLSDDERLMKQLEHSMYGHNYGVVFGFNLLAGIDRIEKAKHEIKKIYSDANIEKIDKSDFKEFWEEIDFGLNYRGDSGAGLELTAAQEKNLFALQDEYKKFVRKFVRVNTDIYDLTDYKGIPGDSVWWDYSYFLINGDGQSIFLYASVSD